MKKVLSLLLACLLLFSVFSMVTFADSPTTTIIGFSGDEAPMLDTRHIEDFGDQVVGAEQDSLKVYLNWEYFDFGGNGADITQVTENVINNCTLHMDLAGYNDWGDIFVRPPAKNDDRKTDEQPWWILTGRDIGKVEGEIWLEYFDPKTGRKDVSLRYPINGAFIDPTINKHIVAISGENMATDSRYVAHNGRKIWEYSKDKDNPEKLTQYLENISIQPGDKLEFSLHTDHFYWDPPIDMRASVRKSTLDNDQINALKTVTKGNDIIESVGFENIEKQSVAYVIRFKEDVPITKERDLEMNIALGIRGKRNEDSSVDIVGTFGNPIYYADQDNDYVFTGDGMVVEAERFIRNIELDLGEGVSVFGNLAENIRYYGRVGVLPTQDDRDIMNYFPTIRKALTLSVNNVDKMAKYVTLDEEIQYYVYDADGKYLGRSNEQLPFRTKYYLSTELLNFDVDFGDMELAPIDQLDEQALNPPTGGGVITPNTMLMSSLGLVAVAVGVLLVADDKKSKNK